MLLQVLQFTPDQINALDPTQKASIMQLVRVVSHPMFLVLFLSITPLFAALRFSRSPFSFVWPDSISQGYNIII